MTETPTPKEALKALAADLEELGEDLDLVDVVEGDLAGVATRDEHQLKVSGVAVDLGDTHVMTPFHT